MDKYMHNQIFDHVSEIILFLLLPGLIAPPTAEVEQSFSIMKLVDTPPPSLNVICPKKTMLIACAFASLKNYWDLIIKQYFKDGWMPSQQSLASIKLLVV